MSIRAKRILFVTATLVFAGLGLGVVRFWPAVGTKVQAAQEALARRDFVAARRLLKSYCSQHPEDLSALLLAVQTARRDGDYPAARELLTEFKRAGGPELAMEMEQRLLAAQQGDQAEAAILFEFCETLPNAPETPLALEAVIVGALNRLATPFSIDGFLGLKNPPAELAHLQRAIDQWAKTRTAPADRVQGMVWRGRERGLAGDQAAAVSNLKEALTLDPDHFEARAYLALAISQENPVKSLEHFELLLQRHPADVRIQFAVAAFRRSLGELDSARELLDQMLQERPSSPQLLVERGLVALDSRNADEARPFLDKAVRLSPENAEAHLALARCLTMLGDAAGAKRHQQRFLTLDAKRTGAGGDADSKAIPALQPEHTDGQ